MRVFFDTEFHERSDGQIELISLGMVAFDGPRRPPARAPWHQVVSQERRELYIELQFDEEAARAEPFLRDHVLTNLRMHPDMRLTRAQARQRVEDFLSTRMALPRRGAERPELWAYFSSTDWLLLYRLWGRMIDLPPWMPKHPMCLQQRWVAAGRPAGVKPPKPKHAHNALADAWWNAQFSDALDLYEAVAR